MKTRVQKIVFAIVMYFDSEGPNVFNIFEILFKTNLEHFLKTMSTLDNYTTTPSAY